MQIVEQRHKIEDAPSYSEVLEKLTKKGQTCYQSTPKTTMVQQEAFIEKLIRNGHHSVLEHQNLSVNFITNRGVTHELVRHRLAAYSQESTRYCRYDEGHVQFIRPVWLDTKMLGTFDPYASLSNRGFNDPATYFWYLSCISNESFYIKLLNHGWSPQQARDVLPNALKTEIEMTTNIREWRHILDLRCSQQAHSQIRQLMRGLLQELVNQYGVLFRDIYKKHIDQGE